MQCKLKALSEHLVSIIILEVKANFVFTREVRSIWLVNAILQGFQSRRPDVQWVWLGREGKDIWEHVKLPIGRLAHESRFQTSNINYTGYPLPVRKESFSILCSRTLCNRFETRGSENTYSSGEGLVAIDSVVSSVLESDDENHAESEGLLNKALT